ncbi:RNA degradosome polyphosphate kinase [Hamadaea tsunoensis]|uniref:RNA degradosome polyphosphate kinase n=1 Tax=Hamadaea tsunoensis TaxID=53368 RepID=UPI001FDF79E8|nr:RNA degradosome polyphosphate kinase [Hamadaea tsunoensis]
MSTSDRPDSPSNDRQPDLPDDRFFNRELTWLDFNARVLTLAEDPATPLLERAKFLAIFAMNLDEFFMVRFAALQRRWQTGLPLRGVDRKPPRQQLDLITQKASDLVARHSTCFEQHVRPLLADAGIVFESWEKLSESEQEKLHTYFAEYLFPVLTPLAVDPAHPFPYISGLSLNLAVVVRDPDGGPDLFARVKVPANVPRFATVSPGRFIAVEELIAVHVDRLFPGMSIVDHHLFRVTRNAEVEIEEDRDEDLLQALERELARRKFGPPVRLEVADDMTAEIEETLIRELDVDGRDVQRIPSVLDLSALWQVYEESDRPELKEPRFVPETHPRLRDGDRSVFSVIRDGDILLHHPYHSFSTSVQRFIEQAAADPNVLAIKQTLYRTSGDSPIVDALVDAAEAGKQVVVVVEVKARFDEWANIGWARTLERAGCHVVYGLVGLKTHAKIALVVRQEGAILRRYCHVGTGNYHPKTARLYEDFGLLTSAPEVGSDVTELFNRLTGYGRPPSYRRLLVAPEGVRGGLLELIDGQIKRGRRGLIQMKVNSLVDDEMVDALYAASRAGVQVDLVVRGMCTLKPGVKGLSDRIRVRSVLGRFLEHSRVFRFGQGAVAQWWLGSADVMLRNLDQRVEALVKVTDQVAVQQLSDAMELYLADTSGGFELRADGSWVRREGADPQLVLLTS